MTLTPEQWEALAEADRIHAEFAALEADERRLHRPHGMNYMASQARLLELLYEHSRALIDAARPKCERCAGDPGVSYETRVAPEARYGGALVARQHRIDCPDCIDHPGFAA